MTKAERGPDGWWFTKNEHGQTIRLSSNLADDVCVGQGKDFFVFEGTDWVTGNKDNQKKYTIVRVDGVKQISKKVINGYYDKFFWTEGDEIVLGEFGNGGWFKRNISQEGENLKGIPSLMKQSLKEGKRRRKQRRQY